MIHKVILHSIKKQSNNDDLNIETLKLLTISKQFGLAEFSNNPFISYILSFFTAVIKGSSYIINISLIHLCLQYIPMCRHIVYYVVLVVDL